MAGRCGGPDFVPVVADGGSGAAAIEIEIGGAIVRVRAGLELAFLGEELRLLKARSDPGPLGDPPSGVRVLIATRPVDFRRGAEVWRQRCNRCCGRIRSAAQSSCSAPNAPTG